MDSFIQSFGSALDMVEGEFLGVAQGHGKRVAVLAAAMAKKRGLPPGTLRRLSVCALLHDNALTQYLAAERPESLDHLKGVAPQDRLDCWQADEMKMHCEIGQTNIDSFGVEADGFIRYHHERADGAGPYRLKAGEYPDGAELIGIADYLDAKKILSSQSPENLGELRAFVESQKGTRFTPQGADDLLAVLDEEMLVSLSNERIAESVAQAVPAWYEDIAEKRIAKIADLAMRVVDYKSAFTRKHSSQVARKAYLIGVSYNLSQIQLAQLYLAAALHDFGKLAIPTSLLEHQGDISEAQYQVVKSHALITRQLLTGIEGMEDICEWASNTHEKLDGSGYPFGKKAAELDFNSRLLACVDIYQATSEERPYHPARDHDDTMKILCALGKLGKLDMEIVGVIDASLVPYSLQKVPACAVG
jgi:HD-GYP domain-containing protein (c-di-GMP phosphodiesterase class II)